MLGRRLASPQAAGGRVAQAWRRLPGRLGG